MENSCYGFFQLLMLNMARQGFFGDIILRGLGPLAQAMNINRGEKMDFLVSVSSSDFLMSDLARTLAATDDFYKPFVDKPFRGNMNVTTIRTNSGRTIMLQHDVSSPRPHVDNYIISGTKATALHYPLPGLYPLSPG